MTATPAVIRSRYAFHGAVAATRPSDTGLVMLASLVGARIAHVELALPAVLLITAANGLLSAGSMAFNDWHDVREDAVNRSRAPIPAGLIARAHVLHLAGGLFATGVLTAWVAGVWWGLASLCIVGGSVLYTTRLKSVPLVGNAVVAAIMSYPMWCWLMVGDLLPGTYAALCLAAVGYRFGAELVKTAEDRWGDALSGVRTVATLWGGRAALVLGTASLAVATAVAWWPAAAGRAGVPYALWLGPVTVLTIMACAESGRQRYAPEEAARRVNRLERISLLVAVVALGAGLA